MKYPPEKSRLDPRRRATWSLTSARLDQCQVRHTGFCVSGQMTVRYDDGNEVNVGPGDVVLLEPGHDAWTVGDVACVILDTGVGAYAKPS